MLRAFYGKIARFLNRLNRSGSESSTASAIREAEDHRQDVQNRSGIHP
jgi:hypothetical protein